jgi:hypothetical protein
MVVIALKSVPVPNVIRLTHPPYASNVKNMGRIQLNSVSVKGV